MATVDLSNDNLLAALSDGNDSIVIVNVIDTVQGGRSLDVSGFAPDVIRRGHIIIEETATKELKPLPVNAGNTAYAALPANHTYQYICNTSVLKTKPMVGLVRIGVVNFKATPYPMDDALVAAFNESNPLIKFVED